MDRRALLGAFSLGAVGLTVLTVGRAEAQQHPHHHDSEHGDCLKACLHGAEVCNETFHYSFAHLKDGHTEHARVAELTIDCQDFCTVAAALLARESSLVAHSCLACAEACKACAEECKKHDDKQMKECVEALMACEKTCRAMSERSKTATPPAR